MARPAFFWLLWVPTILTAQSPDQGQELFRLGRVKFSNNPTDHLFQKITDREFEYLFSKNHQNRPEAYTKAGVDGYLNLIINFKLKVLEARRRGIDTTKAFRTEFEGYKKDILKSFDPVVTNTEQLLVEAYERMKSEVHAAHILLRADPDLSDTLLVYNRCLELRQRVLSGEDFNALARKFSEDPSAATNGGDLGYFTALNMVYPFENAAYSTPVGQVSMPVRTRFGYHLVKVIDIRQAEDETDVSHILVRQGEQIRTPEEAKLRIGQAAARLRSGVSWDEVCKEFSDDPATKDRGGRLQPFRRGALLSVAPEFEEVALAMRKTGEISSPVPSTYGWHIIRFEGKVPMRSLKEMRMVLQQQISRDERSHYSGVKRLQRLKVELGFIEYPAAFHSFLSQADSALLEGKWKFTGTSALASSPIFTIGDRVVRVDNLAAFVMQKQRPAPGQDPEQVMRKWYGSFVQHQIDLAAEERLERGNEKYRYLIKEYKEGMMLFSIMEQEVWGRAAKDTVGQQNYYRTRPGDFMAGNRIFARLLGSGDTLFMKTVRQKVERGDSLTAAELRKFRTYTGFRNYGRGDSKVTDRIEWKIGLHETVVDNIRYLVEVKALVPPGRKTLEEARAEVVSGYQDLLEAKWIAVLRKKYPVRVDEKILSSVTDRILRNKPGS